MTPDSREYAFQTIDATRKVDDISRDLCDRVAELLAKRKKPVGVNGA